MPINQVATAKPIWQPSPARMASSNMQRFIEQQQSQGLAIKDYWQLHAWSLEHSVDFWQQVVDFCQLKFQRPADSVFKPGQMDPQQNRAQWFAGSKLNFAENLLGRRDDKAALIFHREDDFRQEISYQDLYLDVAKVAAKMRQLNIQAGDAVAALMPNCIETVIAMLAASSIGAVFSSCSPDFGSQGVLDRFGQIKPKLLIACNGYCYAGKTLDLAKQLEELEQALLPLGLEHLVLFDFVASGLEQPKLNSQIAWSDFRDETANSIEFAALDFDHPLYILYSSGTTGVPKCIVHGAGGTLLQHQKELVLHTDISDADTVFYFSTCGWMMWNWLVSGLATGASLVLYDGSPFHPSGQVLWDIAEREGITVFGTSAKYISALEKADIKPRHSHQLKLRTLLSTGSPLAHESYDFVYQHIGEDIALNSISGGTDIISCFALGCPLLPVYRGQLQAPGLGMAVEVWSPDGKKLSDEKGELVCRQSFPSMPIYFYNDSDNTKYHGAYFAQFDNCWAHGDYAQLTQQGGLIIHGRSDAVLNPGGVRIGTAEIYRQVEQLDEIVEALAIGQEWQDDVRVVLFVALKQGVKLDQALTTAIKDKIRHNCTPRHVPAKVLQVPELPRTISGKIVELAVRNVVHNKAVKNTDALKNPEALAYFKNLSDLNS